MSSLILQICQYVRIHSIAWMMDSLLYWDADDGKAAEELRNGYTTLRKAKMLIDGVDYTRTRSRDMYKGRSSIDG